MAEKIINDAIHGSFRVDGVRKELLQTPEFNKLSHIKQLGLAHLVFPGAHHTRFEHSLGVSHVGGMMADSVGLDEEEKCLVQVAGMLHDVGHGPYSHTLEHILHENGGMDHMSVTEGIIMGDHDVLRQGEASVFAKRMLVPDILEKYDIDPKRVSDLIRGPDASGSERSLFWSEGENNFSDEDHTLATLVHGPVDCDQTDYLLRDAHFTGVRHGIIDHRHLIHNLHRHAGSVAIDESGIPALEGMLTARALMYSAVYFHRVTRITEVMLSSAVERMNVDDYDPLDMQRMVDAEIWQVLDQQGDYQRDIIRRIKYRQMFKVAMTRRRSDLDEEQVKFLLAIATDSQRRRALEDEIASRAKIDTGYVCIDVPSVKLLLSEPRMADVDIRVRGEDGRYRWFKEHTPMADALRTRQVSQAALYVTTLPSAVESVGKIAERLLFQ
jgi:hypothetical protein